MVKKAIFSTFILLLSVIISGFNIPSLVATCGFAAKTANQIVSVINAYGTASFAISLVLAITGAGASITALVSTVYQFVKKKGTKYAVTW